ncbi:MAG: hypothetical protein PF485_07690 [Bacteroidales bacterium]|jgi:hypothetical protein|nr:hypothetical protein [Bacteroidales bacterium]
MKKIFRFLIIIISIQLLYSCEADEDLLTYDSEIVSVAYGTTFGECIGYCDRTLEIIGTDINFKATGLTATGDLPEIDISGTISIVDWERLVNSIEFLIFRNMEEVIGCPDCTDGGTEWIEITTDELCHKVIFEFDNEPEEILNYIEELRNLMESCEDKMK